MVGKIPNEEMAMKTKAHTVYRNQAGERVPGVTTILNLIAKPNLIVWANRLGLQGIDSTKFRDEKGLIGELAHAFIMGQLKKEETDTSDYSQQQITDAQYCISEWKKWWEPQGVESILIESPVVSELFQTGGTPDHLGRRGEEVILDDWKTGYVGKEAYIQTCTYREFLIENGLPAADKIRIVSLPRSAEESLKIYTYTNFENGWQYFKCLRQCYDLEKLIK